jgi:hypothetical protein
MESSADLIYTGYLPTIPQTTSPLANALDAINLEFLSNHTHQNIKVFAS